MIRRATAYGRKLVKDIWGTYGGEVTFPSIDANVFHGTYIEAGAENQTGQPIYRKQATAIYKRQGKIGFWNFLKWLLTNSVTLAILTILFIMLILLIIIKKRNRKETGYRKSRTKKIRSPKKGQTVSAPSYCLTMTTKVQATQIQHFIRIYY